MLAEVPRLGVRLLIQIAVETEAEAGVTAFLAVSATATANDPAPSTAHPGSS